MRVYEWYDKLKSTKYFMCSFLKNWEGEPTGGLWVAFYLIFPIFINSKVEFTFLRKKGALS